MSLDNAARAPRFGRDLVSNGITSHLRDLILSGQCRPGRPLRIEPLAAQLGVSVTPVRESLLELLGEGFVERIPRRGYVVAALTVDDIRDMFVVNGLLSGELAARATQRIDDDQLGELQQLDRELRSAAREHAYEAMEELNHRLHRLVNQTAGAPKLAWFVQKTSHYAPRWSWQSVDGWPAASLADHKLILATIRRRDADGARHAMQHHIQRSGELLVADLAARGFWDADDAPEIDD